MDRSLALVLVLGLSISAAVALDSRLIAAEGDRLTAERLDDAELTAVTFLDAERGWAVGDRGAIWQTSDGGRTWRVQVSPSDCRWEDIVFVDEKNGWIAGGRVEPVTFKTTGVLLRTRDGGQNWMQLPSPMLPAFKRVAFTDDRHGWTIASASSMYSTGLLETQDGGRSWSPRPGRVGQAWLAGDFRERPRFTAASTTPIRETSPRNHARRSRLGIAAGANGKIAIVMPDELLEVALPVAPDLAVRQVRMSDEGECWMVGDRGLVLHSPDGGLQWQRPAGAIPPSVARCDFTALATCGSHCWIAGAPGSWVLASSDQGATWELHSTGQTLPLKSLHFADERHGWAVGALGTILATRDGGKTWRRQHGGQRLALLAIMSQPESIPFELLAQLCGNDGYRGGAIVLFRRDLETGHVSEALDEQRLHDAVVAAGGSASQLAQRFPVRQRGLPLPIEQHLLGWGNAEEAPELALERYVADQIRQWRPDLVFTDDPDAATDVPLAQLTQRAVMSAVNRAAQPEAADANPTPGLATWQVKKALSILPGSERGLLRLPSTQLASRLGRSLGDASMLSRELIGIVEPPPQQTSFRLLMSQLPQDTGRREFFGGLSIAPGSDARRGATGLGKGDLAALQRSAQQQRNVQQLLLRGGDFARGTAWLAQFDGLTQGLNAEQACDVAWQLARRYEQAGQHEQAAATLVLIAQKYPQQRWCDGALIELLRRQASGELAAWRLAAAGSASPADGDMPESADRAAGAPDTAGNVAELITRLPPPNRSLDVRSKGPSPFVEIPAPAPIRNPSRVIAAAALSSPDEDAPETPRPVARISATDQAALDDENLKEAAPAASREGVVNTREQTVAKLGVWIERSRPWLFAEPEVRAVLAGATARQGRSREVQQWWRSLANRTRDDGWAHVARQELAILDRTEAAKSASGLDDRRIAHCAPSDMPPKLDGRLEEAFWTQAQPLTLASRLLDDAAWPAVVLIARDADNLYLAVNCQKAAGVDYSTTSGPRPRDPNLAARDRVDLYLDVDRDYTSAFQLTIDSRGWVADRCLGDARWNPTWYVAAKDDASSWTVEAAIPWRELASKAPAASEAWALGAQRTIPGVGFQSWTQPASIVGRPDGWGLLIFKE